MTDRSLKELKKFLSKRDVIAPIADFGGVRTKKRVMAVLKELGVNELSIYDINGTPNYDLVNDKLTGEFQTIICMDTLEHVTNPFKVAENIVNCLCDGGNAFITAPFLWKKHGTDYFRFTKEGLTALFAELSIKVFSEYELKDKTFIRSFLIIKKL